MRQTFQLASECRILRAPAPQLICSAYIAAAELLKYSNRIDVPAPSLHWLLNT